MKKRELLSLLSCIAAFFIFNTVYVSAQSNEASEPTTVSSVADTNLPWGAQRILPGKVPAEFDQLLDKVLAEGDSKVKGGEREILAWEGNYKNASKANELKGQLQSNLKKEGWQYQTVAHEGDVEVFGLVKDGAQPRALLGFFVSNDEVFVCALMEIQKADASVALESRPTDNRVSSSGSIVGKWFRTTGGSTIDWTGKTTLKGGEDFTFEFFSDGTVHYTRKKEILNVMQCRINSTDDASGHYKLSGATLTIDLGAMRSANSNSCDAKQNYNKTLGNSSMTVQIQIKQMDDITRPDKPYTMCFDGNEVCYEKQPK
jgi:hypothetical protein